MLRFGLGGIATEHREDFVFRAHRTARYLLLCFRSPYFCELGGVRIEGKPGDCILHRPDALVIHGALAGDVPFCNDWLYFTADPGDLDALHLPFDTVISTGNPDILERALGTVLRESLRNDRFSGRLISDGIYRMLVSVARAAPQAEHEDLPLHLRFSRTRIHILNRYHERWDLARMAELLGYSVSRFCALYTGFFGKSPMSDLLDKRLAMAKELLALGAYGVGDVAQMCGFSSIHYFSNFFKRRTGVSPADYKV